MAMLSNTPPPPYYAVIFSSIRTEGDNGYSATAQRMAEFAAAQPGFLGEESARSDIGITVSYWADLESIRQWKMNAEHLIVQKIGKQKWYRSYRLRVCKVERDQAFEFSDGDSSADQ
ncbi:MAG: antibiotic biosynthesis monooxygenase family protein [Saprospiraceae bacterium]